VLEIVKRASRDVRLDFVVEISPHDYLHIDHVRDLSLADLEIGSSMLLTSSFITFFSISQDNYVQCLLRFEHLF
jgi:hypothetical protein